MMWWQDLPRVVLARVVDHGVRAKARHECAIGTAADARNLGSQMPCDLDRRTAHRARGSDDQNTLAFANPSLVAQKI